MSREYDASNGYYGGRPAYIEQNGDTTDVFPGGPPREHHSRIDHDHTRYNEDGGVTYMREGGEIINDYGNGR